MILPLLLTLAPATAAPQVAPQPAPGSTQPAPRRETRQERRRRKQLEQSLLHRGSQNQVSLGGGTVLGGSFTVGGLGAISSASMTHLPGVFQLELDDPGTGWQERVLLGTPAVNHFVEKPLLVMFHGYSISEWDCYLNSPIFQDAMNRGWYVIAPLGAHDTNFGIPYSQVNIEYALKLFTSLLPVDPNRVYGLGFSMGGGTMMSYAARHQDPQSPRFAAVINHTGGVSIANTYWNTTNTFEFDHPLLFGGSPAEFPFIYSQASVVDIDFNSGVIDPNTDQARNLAHLPVLNQHADFDPLVYLVDQTLAVYSWLQSVGSETFLLTPNQAVHDWETIDSNTALNFLYSKTLTIPTEGQHEVLADREATWFHFYVEQDTEGAFTPFRWNFEPAFNRLTIDQSKNLKSMVVNTQTLGLNPAVNLELRIASPEGGSEIVTLEGYALSPQEVLRNGVATTNDWVWDANAKTITITENDPGSAPLWKIRP